MWHNFINKPVSAFYIKGHIKLILLLKKDIKLSNLVKTASWHFVLWYSLWNSQSLDNIITVFESIHLTDPISWFPPCWQWSFCKIWFWNILSQRTRSFIKCVCVCKTESNRSQVRSDSFSKSQSFFRTSLQCSLRCLVDLGLLLKAIGHLVILPLQIHVSFKGQVKRTSLL